MPVTVKIPTHVEVRIVEQRYLQSDGHLLATDKDGKVPLVTTRVDYFVREKEEVMLVDSNRPAAGTLTYAATFKGQFFDGYNTKIDDKTIETITGVINNIASLRKPPAKAAALIGDENVNITAVDRIVAVKVFDVRCPDIQAQVQQFANDYLNNCAPPCQPASPAERVTHPVSR